MEENENKIEETQENKQESEFKKQTANVINEAKEQMKNINIKEEAEKGKNLFLKLFKEPIKTIKEIAQDEQNKTQKTAIILIIIWVVSVLFRQIIFYATSKYYDFDFLDTLKVILSPVLVIAGMTVSIYFLNKNSKKSISRIITSVTIAKIPTIVSSLVVYLNYIHSKVYNLTDPIRTFLSIISMVIMYFTVKFLFEENDDETAVKQFVKVEAIYYVIAFIISFFGITM
ncbi:MAG: hypothetical protein IJV31_09110 [Clostridia bacterium]|nr:hypothetical protein [Clostridia bacterium]